MLLAGQQFAAGWGLATVHPDFDFETRSDAGFVWAQEWNVKKQKYELKLRPLPGFGDQKKGLKAVGVRVYIEHPTFYPLMLGYDLKDGRGPHQWNWGDRYDVLEPLFEHIRAGRLIEAQNVGFEYQVWQYWCVPKLGWPMIDPQQLRCSAAKSKANGLPAALAEVGDVLQIAHAKDPDGKRLIKKFTEPKLPTAKDPRTHIWPCEDLIDGQKFRDYNLRDLVAESEVSIASPDLTPFELAVWQLDQRINDRGVQVDTDGIRNCIHIYEQVEAKYGAEIRALTGGIEASELDQLKGWLSGQGIPMQGMTEDDVDSMVKRLAKYSDEQHGELGQYEAGYRALKIRQLIGSASVKKLYAMDAGQSAAGRIHNMYSFQGAHTGLWTAYDPQPQNLVSGEWSKFPQIEHALKVIGYRSLEAVEFEFNGDAIGAIKNCLRSLFIAKKGSTLVSSDYSAIQGVLTAQLAGERWMLEVFHTHGMIYEMTAAKLTGIPFEEFIAHRVKTGGVAHYFSDGTLSHIIGGKHHPRRQDMGKIPSLASGFAGWIGAYKRFGADEFFDNDYAIKNVILKWRDDSPAIVEWWGGQTRGGFGRGDPRPELFGLEGAAISAVKYPGQAFYARQIGFQQLGDVLYMLLPSGRLIAYHTPRLRPSERPYAQPWEQALSFWGFNTNPTKGPYGWIQQDLYGGVLCQNAVSGTARDIMAHGMLNLDAAGFPIVLHTHDEAVAEVELMQAIFPSHGIAAFEECLNDLPAYAKGWPIKAKGGWVFPRYGKFD